jgi:hypothetical protein
MLLKHVRDHAFLLSRQNEQLHKIVSSCGKVMVCAIFIHSFVPSRFQLSMTH